MRYKGVIFDFNGTLFLDTEFHVMAWEQVAQMILKKELDDETRHMLKGGHNKQILYNLDNTMSESENNAFSLKKEEIYRSICLNNPQQLHLVPGSVETFNKLKEHHVPMTIASASIEDNIDFFIDTFELSKWFDKDKIIYDNGLYKDKSSMFLEACKVLDISPLEAVAIEDSQTGISNAKAAHIGCIIGIGPFDTHKLLKEYGANICIEDFTGIDIYNLIENKK